jgi:6-pyruvoyltetrahydropterin/6-carboxytetrahydropterin synthase
MFRLTRQVRFAVDDASVESSPRDNESGNGWSGVPELTGFARFFELDVTVAGDLESESQYLINIKTIDTAVRKRLVPIVRGALRGDGPPNPARLIAVLHAKLAAELSPVQLHELRLWSSPFQSVMVRTGELPMIRYTQQFEFAASHRLHNPALSDDQNRQMFGKCNNPLGHGHNYIVEIAVLGTPGDSAGLVDQHEFRTAVTRVIDRFDHRHLNHELPEFQEQIPTVENIAKVIYGLLKSPLQGHRAKLASVKVWETAKTSCEYSE